jgi:hypothetical protein
MGTTKVKLRYRDRDTLFKKEHTELKIKVALNWFELAVLVIVNSFLSYIGINHFFQFENIFIPVGIAVVISVGISYLFCCFRNYQLKITRFDKEHIYKKISNELIDKTKD